MQIRSQRRKLIEVALPLDAINAASAREKSIRHGHPSTLHLWWARRPLAAARAVIFSQMADDPSTYVDALLSDPTLRTAAQRELRKRMGERAAKQDLSGETSTEPEPTIEEVAADIERRRLFAIIEDLVKWENTCNETVLQRAREELWQSWRRACAENADHPRAKELFDRHKLPAFHDPFAGGGGLPLEAQRLGLEAHACDLNPVAVLINKAMIEIPHRFAGRQPVNPEARRRRDLVAAELSGARGLADDVRYYGKWIRDEAERRLGHLYPKVEVTEEMTKERPDLTKYLGQHLTVIAWLWARTVRSPNPAFAEVDVPLASTFMLSTKRGKEAYVEPILDGDRYRFLVKVGKPTDPKAARAGTKLGRGANFSCLMSGTPMDGKYIMAEGSAGRMGTRLLAIVVEGDRGRVYLTPTPEQEAIPGTATPQWRPDVEFFQQALGFRVGNYGMTRWSDLYTNRQLLALSVLSDLVQTVGDRVRRDALDSGPGFDDDTPLDAGGTGAMAYAQAVTTSLSLCVSRQANRSSTLNIWDQKGENVQQVFGMQILRMTWDFVEGNPFSDSTGNFSGQVGYFAKVLEYSCSASAPGFARQQDAQRQSDSSGRVVSTDPPYYDNVGYADLSDFFYVWLRRSLGGTYPELLATVVVPKDEELVATPDRHGGKGNAERFFLEGMKEAMRRLAEQAHPAFPVTIYYAFKQSEAESAGSTIRTGWETFLDAVLSAGFAVSGTWPVRTEYTGNLKSKRSALASSIVLVCRSGVKDAPTASRREFLGALKEQLPRALGHLQRSNIAPVDLAQAAIGPGMAVYTRYSKVLESDGSQLRVRTALALINQVLDETLAEQEGDFDADTRWALAWFEQSGFDEGEYGVAETLSKAKNTSVSGLVGAGILMSKAGKVRLLAPAELPEDWDPKHDSRLTVWEMVHHLIQALEAGGEAAASELAAKLGATADAARELAYRLYSLCERKKRANLALSYNALVQSWPEITRLAQEAGKPRVDAPKLPGME